MEQGAQRQSIQKHSAQEHGIQAQKEKFAALAVCLFVGAYPLFLLRGYVDVAEAKLLLLKGILLFTAGGIFLLQLTDVCLQVNKKQYLKEKIKGFVRSLSLTDKAVLGLAASFWISFALSWDKQAAWTGQEANGSGMLYYQFAFLLYFLVSRYYVPGKRELTWWFVSTILLTGYGLVQFLGFDFLQLFPKGADGIVTDFLSFLGNTGVFALYICLVLPAALYFSCRTDQVQTSTVERVLCPVTFYLCCTGILCANCDAGYLGLAAGWAGTAILTAKDERAAVRFWLLTAGMCFCVKLTGLLFSLFEETVRNVSRMTAGLLESPLVWLAGAGSLAMAAFLKVGLTRSNPSESNQRNASLFKGYRSICVFVTVLAVLALGGAFLWLSLVDRGTPLGRLEHYLRFSDSWGTERGYIFSRLLWTFGEGNVLQKLFGWGPGMTFPVIQARFWEEMCSRFEYVYDDAHSQWITLLITTGLSGCLWMGAALLSGIWRVFQKGREPVWAVVLMVYLAVSAVSLTQPITGIYLWLGLGIVETSVKYSEGKLCS